MHEISIRLFLDASNLYLLDYYYHEEWDRLGMMCHILCKLEGFPYQISHGLIIKQNTTPKDIFMYCSKLFDHIRTEYLVRALAIKSLVFTTDRDDDLIPELANPILYKVEIANVYKGCFFDYEQLETLEKVDLETYQPESTDSFELLFNLRISFADSSLEAEDFYITITTLDNVKRRYDAYFLEHPDEKVVYSYKFFSFKNYNLAEIKHSIDYCCIRAQANTKQLLMFKFLNFCDHPNRDTLLKEKIDVKKIENKRQLDRKIEPPIKFKMYDEDWKLICE